MGWASLGDPGPAPLPAMLFCSPGFVAPTRDGKKLSEQLYILGEKKHSLASGHILADMCVVSVSCASSSREPSGFPHQSPLELL